jgi:WD40 repeat protein
MAWSEDSKRILVGGEGREKFGHVFMMDGGSSVGEISGHAKPILSVDMKQTRPYRIATAGEDLVAWFEGPPFKFKKSLKEHSKFINCVRFSPNGEV